MPYNEQNQEQPMFGGKFDSNPFASIISGGGENVPQPATPQQSAPSAQQDPRSMMMMMQGKNAPKSDLQPGQVAGVSPYVLSALQSLQKALSEATDPADLQILRSLVELLARFLSKDNQKQIQQLPQEEQNPAGQPPAGQIPA